MPSSKINVHLISGFLGSGKTTLLNNWLKRLNTTDVAVVENEFGSISLDGDAVSRYAEEVYELNNGCICCTVGEEFFRLLSDIALSNTPPLRLFIETTGIADISALTGLFSEATISQRFALRNTFCVVDAENIEERLSQVPEVARQIAFADVLVLNKAALVSKDHIKNLSEMLLNMNPFAQMVTTQNGALPVSSLEVQPRKTSLPLLLQVQKKGMEAKGAYVPHQVNAVVVTTTQYFELKKLEEVLNMALVRYPDQIYRIKGIVWGKNGTSCYNLQSTGKRISLKAMPALDRMHQTSSVVMIGKNLKEATLQRLLKQAIIQVLGGL